jgi:uncharacterized protein
MAKLPEQVAQFLSQQPFAVAGVSRDAQQPANAVFRKLRGAGYRVYAVNPKAAEVEGGPCYPNLHALPEPVKAVVIVTPPEQTATVVRECAELGIRYVWLHRSFGQGSVSAEAERECGRLKIKCLVGGCPLMYCEPVDIGHRCMKWLLELQRLVPE